MRWELDADGGRQAYEYASNNHLTKHIDALGVVTAYEHTPTGELTAVTDPGGTRTEYVRDLKDRVVEVRRHGRVRERYIYDAADNLVEKRDGAGGLLLELSIGAGNLVLARKLGSGEQQTFDYDRQGRLTAARGSAGRCHFAYSAAGVRVRDFRDGRGVEHACEAGVRRTSVLGLFQTTYRATSRGDLAITDPTTQTHTVSQLALGVTKPRRWFEPVRVYD